MTASGGSHRKRFGQMDRRHDKEPACRDRHARSALGASAGPAIRLFNDCRKALQYRGQAQGTEAPVTVREGPRARTSDRESGRIAQTGEFEKLCCEIVPRSRDSDHGAT